jgi:hypothetical protein
MLSPAALSLRWLREERGFTADIVERRLTGRVTKDFLGCLDIVAVHRVQGTLGVQTTTASNLQARCRKLELVPAVRDLLLCGWEVHVHGWRRGGRHGGQVLILRRLAARLRCDKDRLIAWEELGRDEMPMRRRATAA